MIAGSVIALLVVLGILNKRRRAIAIGLLFPLVVVGALRAWCFETRTLRERELQNTREKYVPRSREDEYVSSNRCQSCHPGAYATWHDTFHRTMTQVASPETVVGDFSNQTIDSQGLSYTVFRKGDEFWARLPDPEQMMEIVMGNRPKRVEEVPIVERRVVMTTGSHHYQTYWVEGDPKFGKLLQTLPLVYLIKDKRWIPRENAFMSAPGSPRMITQWNHHCIKCHSTGGNPGLHDDVAHGRFDTQVAELGIACEACHGPGEEHVAANRDPRRRYELHAKGEGDSTIVNPATIDHKRSSQICGQCHGSFVHEGDNGWKYAKEGILYRPGDDIHKLRFYIDHPLNANTQENWQNYERNRDYFRGRFWDDGTMLSAGREFTALKASKCFTDGEISCLSCHSMHGSDPNDQLIERMDTSLACTQCHNDEIYTTNLSEHTHHSVESTGSNCLNCHMPHTSYALFSAIRSHQIQSPQIDASVKHNLPSACNLCHLDQTLEWTAKYMEEWYGQTPTVSLTDEERQTSAALLWMLKGNAVQRVITAWHVGWKPAQQVSGDDWLAPFQAQLLTDPYGVVRYVAHKNLQNLPGFDSFEYDFLANETELAASRSKAVALWNDMRSGGAQNAPLDPQANRHKLLSVQGELLQRKMLQILSDRDDTPMNIEE